MNSLGHRSGIVEHKKDLVDRVNRYYVIERKTHEVTGGDGRTPLTNTPEVRRFAFNSMKRLGIDVPYGFLENRVIDPESINEITGWNLFWSLEQAGVMTAIAHGGGTYERHLPGRFLHYDVAAHRIASLFNGDERNSIRDKKVLELGCGSGLSLIRLADKGAYTVGLDSAIMALEFANYLADISKVSSKVRLAQGDYFRSPFRDEEFDASFNFGVFEHLEGERSDQLLSEMKRVTKHGGYIIIGIPNEESPFYKSFKRNQEDIKNIFPSLIDIPVEHSRYTLNIRKLIEDASLSLIRKDGIFVAPSSPIKPENISDDDVSTFDIYLPKSRPSSIESKVAAWRGLELMSDLEFRIRYGWSVYYVAQKK